MATNNIGDRLLSFGGYTFIPDNTLDMDYPLQPRNQLVVIPSQNFSFNVYGTRRAPYEATDLTFTYWLAEKTDGSPIATNAELKTELALIKDALTSIGTGLLVTQERTDEGGGSHLTYTAYAVFKNLDPKIIAENLVSVPLTIVFTPLTTFS